MKYTLIVHSPPNAGGGSRSALAFARALLAAGHETTRVFFYHDGVENGLAGRVTPQGESDLLGAWEAFTRDTGSELALCIAAALRRGVLNDEEAQRYDRAGPTISSAFTIVGLGQLVDAMLQSDRCVTFV
ncbi:MAG: sulfurtransferase complex subunit TusD [Pseudomonadales bacterium]|nr:sulfurtransferase complex subunit TusD [Pseudomonadales bacterium]MCP5185754.1 sulfurtransferase complex subunit TusD [Pseudomonadales bacterium]